MKVHVQHI